MRRFLIASIVLLLPAAAANLAAFSADADPGAIRDPATAGAADRGRSLDSVAHSRLAPAAGRVWAGQVFDLSYDLDADGGYTPSIDRGQFEWTSDPLITEDWTGPRLSQHPENGSTWYDFGYTTRALAPRAGTYTLNPARQIVYLAEGAFGFFGTKQYQPFSVSSTTPALEVRPLPPAPAGFRGAVGRFQFVSRLIPETAAVGEPLTWTLELSGTGNWPQIGGLPARSVSRDFQVVRPQTRRTPAKGKVFDAAMSEDAVLVPTHPGRYTLPEVDFVYFDPASGAYRTISTDPIELTISPAAANGPSGPPAAAAGPGAMLVAPELPSGLPGDPLPEGKPASAPLANGDIAGGLAAAAALVVFIWLGLALRRARATDPRRPEREARRRLAAILGRMSQAAAPGGDGDALRSHLLLWQREAARIWSLRESAPGPGNFTAPEWSRLWAESEAALYGRTPTLPADWLERAGGALRVRPEPAGATWQLFLGRNLFPFLVLALAFAGSARADTPDAAYRRGDFAAAAAGWKTAAPRDAAARYDLSLALGQQGHWPEALAEAAAAFVERPADPAIRRQFALACNQADISPGPLAPFVAPGAPARFAALASAPDWQRLLVLAGWVGGAAVLVLLLAGYGVIRHRRIAALTAILLFALAALTAGAAVFGWSAYGPAADENAVFVWRADALRSVPTEADTSQSTTQISAGLVGVETRSFLGWVDVRFPNDQTGWLRRGDVVRLWK